jgi:hypothetical protein
LGAAVFAIRTSWMPFMATSARASAQSSRTDGRSPDTSSGSADASSSIPQNELDFGSLAIDACDKADSLRELLSAYTCVEKLIEPAELGDSNLVNPTRTELGALVRVVNEEMERRIDSIDKTLQSMRSALDAQPAVQRP